MASTAETYFRTTTWPRIPLPVPKVEVWPVEIRGDRLVFSSAGGESKEVEIPRDFYLRELPELDLDDDSAILEFSRAYGQLGDAELNDLPWMLQPENDYGGEYAQALFPERSSLRGEAASPSEEPEEDEQHWSMKLGVFRLHALALRDVSRIIYRQQARMTFDEVSAAWETPGPAHRVPVDMVDFFVNVVNAGLKYFAVQVGAELPNERGKPSIIWSQAGPNLYQVVCLQVRNHIYEDAVLRQCANETCKQFFSRQRDRAEKGKYHTSNVMYCSWACAKAQAQRELRRHRQEALNLHRRGLDVPEIAAELGVEEGQARVWLQAALKRGKK